MKKNTLNLNDVLEILKKRKRDFEDAYGVTAIGVFGSFAREKAKQSTFGKSWGYKYDTYFQPENAPVKLVIFMLAARKKVQN